MTHYSIQELSELTSLSRRTIHFYVQQGILPAPEGAGLGTRYSEEHLLCLKVIPLLRRRGLKLDEIRARLKGMNVKALRVLQDELFEPEPPRLLPVSQPFAHYPLPAGMTLTVPASMKPADRKKLAELLKAANEIFS